MPPRCPPACVGSAVPSRIVGTLQDGCVGTPEFLEPDAVDAGHFLRIGHKFGRGAAPHHHRRGRESAAGDEVVEAADDLRLSDLQAHFFPQFAQRAGAAPALRFR